MGTKAKALDLLPGFLGTTEKESVLSSGRSESKLVEGDNFTSGLDDSLTSTRGDAESGNGDLGEVRKNTNIIGNGADNDNNLLSVTLGFDSLLDTSDRHRRSVSLAQKQSAEDDRIELGVSSAYSVRVSNRKLAYILTTTTAAVIFEFGLSAVIIF